MRNFRPDVLFAHSALPAAYSRVAGLGLKNIRVVPVFHAEDDFANAKLRAAEYLLRFGSSASLFVSERALNNYERRIGRGTNLVLIRNGISIDSFACSGERTSLARSRLGLGTDSKV